MNKKWIISMVMLVQGATLFAAPVATKLEDSIVTTSIEQTKEGEDIKEEKSLYITRTGTVSEVKSNENGYSLLVGDYMNGVIFNMQSSIQVFDANTLKFVSVADIKEGMDVTVVMPKNSPMTMSLPGRSSSALAVIINDAEKNIEVSYFNEELVNEANNLALNIAKDTMIINNVGMKKLFVADDIKNKNAIVVYDITTRSIPAQTTPYFVMIIEDEVETEVETEIETPQIQDQKAIQKDEYTAIRQLANDHTYDIKWIKDTKTVILTKEDQELKFTVGKSQYTHNGEVKSLEGKIELKDNAVYVPSTLEKNL